MAVSAYVLIQTEVGKAAYVAGHVRDLPGVISADDVTGSYDVIWWFSILFGVLSALINLPIVEKPVVRPALQPA